MLERFEFPYTVVRSSDFGAEDLRDRFDVVILPDGALPATSGTASKQPRQKGGAKSPAPSSSLVANLGKFLKAGGIIHAEGTSTSLAAQLKLPVADHLASRDAKGNARSLPRDKFYIPGSVLRVKLDPKQPIAWGLPEQIDVMFSASPTPASEAVA